MKILVTGANGFLGQALVKSLAARGDDVIGAIRVEGNVVPVDGVTFQAVGDINADTDWSSVLAGVEVVIHCAARVHVMSDRENDPQAAFNAVNVEGTMRLARQAESAGVLRFVFISSIKVNGEATDNRPPFDEKDPNRPEDPYGVSKAEAEKQLAALQQKTSMELVIVRPPLVYGPGIKANFLNLLKLSDSGLLLPFGAVHNQRSMVYLGNLVDFLTHVTQSSQARNEVFVLTDGQDLSTADLIKLLRRLLGRPARLVPVPNVIFRLAASVFGKQAFVQRLIGSLQVDSSKARRVLGWTPPYSVEQGLTSTVNWFRKTRS